MKKNEINNKYKKIHSDLEERYYKNKEISKEEFDFFHGKLWNDHENELIENGFKKPKKTKEQIDYEKTELKAKQDLLKLKLKLSDEEIEILKTML